MTTKYWIQLHTTPRPNRLPSLTRAVVYQGHPGVMMTATQAYEHNAGAGIAAAIKDARAWIDGQTAVDFFSRPSNDSTKATAPATVLTVESEGPMARDYLSTYTTMSVIAGAVCALLMKGCG